MIRLIIISIVFLLSHHLSAQQESQSTQFPYLRALINPAKAGVDDILSVSLRHRNQWAGLQGAPQSQSIVIEFPRVFNALGLGLNINRQMIGITEKIDLQLSYGYSFNINDNILSLGLNSSYRRLTQDFTKEELIAIEGFELDPSIDRTVYNSDIYNVGFGLLWQTSKHFLGISLPRTVKSKFDFDAELDDLSTQEFRHAYVIGSYTFLLQDDWKFEPTFLFKIIENAPLDFDLFSNFIYKEQLFLGMNIRAGGTTDSLFDSVALIFGLQMHKDIFASISYDFTTSKIGRYENGSFELILNYTLNSRRLPKEIKNPSLN